MARISRGIFPSLTICHLRVPILIFLALFAILLGANVATAHSHGNDFTKHGDVVAPTNSCVVTWLSSAGHPAARPTVAFSGPLYDHNPNVWPLRRSAVSSNYAFADFEMDEAQYEIYRVDRLRKALEWAECLANDWPELDLNWCLADWHDGNLIEESLNHLGQTHWQSDPNDLTSEATAVKPGKIPILLMPTSWVYFIALYITHIMSSVQFWTKLFSGYHASTLIQIVTTMLEQLWDRIMLN